MESLLVESGQEGSIVGEWGGEVQIRLAATRWMAL